MIKKFYFFNYSKSNDVRTKFSARASTFLENLIAKRKNYKIHSYLLQSLNRSAIPALNLYDFNDGFNDYDGVETRLTRTVQKDISFKDFFVSFNDVTLLNNEVLRNNLASYSALSEQNAKMFTNFVLNQETFKLEELETPSFLVVANNFEDLAEHFMRDEKNIDKIFSEDLIDYVDSLPKNK